MNTSKEQRERVQEQIKAELQACEPLTESSIIRRCVDQIVCTKEEVEEELGFLQVFGMVGPWEEDDESSGLEWRD